MCNEEEKCNVLQMSNTSEDHWGLEQLLQIIINQASIDCKTLITILEDHFIGKISNIKL